MENKNQKIGLIIILSTVLFLAIIFIGITYAFFTANNPEGSTAQIISETGRMVINYDDGTDIIQPVTGIVPSNVIIVNKTFSLIGSNTTVGMKPGDGLSMPYKVGVQYTSTFSDGMMHYYIKEVERPTNSNVTVNYVITPEPGKTEDDYKNQTVPGNDTYTEYTHGTFKNGKKYTEMVTGEFPASLNDQTITFNLIIQFPDNNENQDSEKGKTFNGKVVVNYEPSFANDSWDEIAAIVKVNPKSYAVGSTKTLKVYDNPNGETTNGTYKEYTVRVANNTTPPECNDSNFSQTACGFVVEFVDIVEKRRMNESFTNVGGWRDSEMRKYLNGDTDDHMTYNDANNGQTATFFSKLPKELRDAIIDITVISGHGSTTGETNFPSTDKIYLLSAHEVWEDGTSNQVSSKDTAWDKTRQLDYYKNLGVTTSNYSGAIKMNNGSNSYWWLRAPNSASDGSFLTVTNSGYWDRYNARSTYGFAPAFRIG